MSDLEHLYKTDNKNISDNEKWNDIMNCVNLYIANSNQLDIPNNYKTFVNIIHKNGQTKNGETIEIAINNIFVCLNKKGYKTKQMNVFSHYVLP